MKNTICVILVSLILLCTGCTVNYVRDSCAVNIDARKDIKVTDPTTTIGLPVL